MGTKKQLSSIFESDVNRSKIGILRSAPRNKDSSHLQRRQQQRAINDPMIKVALLYGHKHFNKGATIFTLNDRSLQQTPYSRFAGTLRGLRVVCLNGLPNPQILTVYWHQKTKHKVRK
ncbi:MAG: hypothetical protein NVS2B14_21990 [Chamaesiphon sp.]